MWGLHFPKVCPTFSKIDPGAQTWSLCACKLQKHPWMFKPHPRLILEPRCNTKSLVRPSTLFTLANVGPVLKRHWRQGRTRCCKPEGPPACTTVHAAVLMCAWTLKRAHTNGTSPGRGVSSASKQRGSCSLLHAQRWQKLDKKSSERNTL
jgi:hypothetical protein